MSRIPPRASPWLPSYPLRWLPLRTGQRYNLLLPQYRNRVSGPGAFATGQPLGDVPKEQIEDGPLRSACREYPPAAVIPTAYCRFRPLPPSKSAI